MKPTVEDLKIMLYDVIKTAAIQNSTPDMDVAQNMGISLTNSIRKEGINIIQIQNVKSDFLIPKLINMLEHIDNIPVINVNTELIEHKPEPLDPLRIICDYIYNESLDWKTFNDILKVKLYHYLVDKLNSSETTLRFMGISRGSISQSKKRLEDSNAE